MNFNMKTFFGRHAGSRWVTVSILSLGVMMSAAWGQGVPATPNKPARSTTTAATPKKAAAADNAASTSQAPAGTMLSKEDLRVCLKDKEEILAQRAKLEKDQGDSQAARQQILDQAKVLKDAMATIDRTAPGVLDAHDAKVDAHEKRIEVWNQNHRELLATIETLNKKQARWTTDCGEKRYREEDEIAIRAGK